MNPGSGNGLPGLGRVLVWLNDPSNWTGPSGLFERTIQHLAYTAIVTVIAAAIAIPLGIYIGHTGRGKALIAGLANALRAIPALGLLVFLIVLLSPHIHLPGGVGTVLPDGSLPYFIPALIVLVMIAVPPMLTATYAGIQATDPTARDAARAIGMNDRQAVLEIELPAAVPIMMTGVRSAVLQVIASLTVAAYAPLVGGLGRFIVDGDQNLADLRYGYPAMVSAGIVIAILAVIVDLILALAQRLLTSPGLIEPGGHEARTTQPTALNEQPPLISNLGSTP